MLHRVGVTGNPAGTVAGLHGTEKEVSGMIGNYEKQRLQKLEMTKKLSQLARKCWEMLEMLPEKGECCQKGKQWVLLHHKSDLQSRVSILIQMREHNPELTP
ncbi:hypothetical protein E2542_SST04888 [Spatholobus suberectus]|nr:hypothetical protein E2542_SST04888 [Spatholobus suberectus]